MKAKHLVSMLLAGSRLILGLAACAPTTNSGGGNDSPQPTGTDSGSGGASSEYLVYNVGEETRRPGTPSLTPPAWAAMSF